MSDDGSDGEVYEVEKILDKRTKKGKTEYLIKGKGKLVSGLAWSIGPCVIDNPSYCRLRGRSREHLGTHR